MSAFDCNRKMRVISDGIFSSHLQCSHQGRFRLHVIDFAQQRLVKKKDQTVLPSAADIVGFVNMSSIFLRLLQWNCGASTPNWFFKLLAKILSHYLWNCRKGNTLSITCLLFNDLAAIITGADWRFFILVHINFIILPGTRGMCKQTPRYAKSHVSLNSSW